MRCETDTHSQARKNEEILAKRVDGISANLHKALHTHSRQTHEDISHSLIEHARTVILYERQLLKELESLRTDFSHINKKSIAVSSPPQQNLAIPGGPARVNRAPDIPKSVNGPMRAQSAGPPQARMDGTQSMFITPPAASQALPPDGAPRQPASPGFVAQRAVFGASPSGSPPPNHDPLGASSPRRPGDSIHGKPGQNVSHTNTLARSMYVQPTRSRLDAREAAAKLANFL